MVYTRLLLHPLRLSRKSPAAAFMPQQPSDHAPRRTMPADALACAPAPASAPPAVTASPALDRFCLEVRARALRLALLETAGNAAAAADLVQDSLERLVAHYHQRPQAEWAPLFYGILRNRITDWHRRRKVEKVLEFFFPGDDDPDAAGPAWEQLVDEAPGPEQRLQGLQQAARIADALQRLSARQRQVFLLREMEDMTIADTARAMDISEGSVKTHHLRALTRLREWLRDDQPRARPPQHAS